MNAPPVPAAPRIRMHPAGAGLAWVRQGLLLYARYPLVLVVLVGLGPLFLATLQAVPLYGDFAALVLTPAIGLGMLNVCRSARLGVTPGIGSYVSTLREPLARLRVLQLGVVYVLFAGVLALLLAALLPEHAAAPADASAPANGAGAATAPPPVPGGAGVPVAPGTPAAPEFAFGAVPLPVLAATVVLVLPFMMAVWFAPALAGWYRMSVPKALFFSFFACWRNRWAILVYLSTLLGLSIVAVMFVGTLIALLNARDGMAPYLLVAPLVFLTLTISQCANLAMVQDIIDDGEAIDAAMPAVPPALPPG